ncbi:methyltransferase [Saprospiraceae bacterium]|nr:methyltransferase [Saprospiraceae bacterium]
MRGRIRKIIQPFLWKGYRWYLKKKRWYNHDGLKVCIYPSVFHPGLLWTTLYLLKFISHLELKEKRVLELSAGSGLIALWTSRAGAIVSASDINPAAIRSMKESAESNKLSLDIFHSDLFDAIPPQQFDYIFINPPFYPKKASNDRERAFYCGPDFEYFRKLFLQIKKFIMPSTQIFLVLTDDCDLTTLSSLAQTENGILELKAEQTKWKEQQLIYQLCYQDF